MCLYTKCLFCVSELTLSSAETIILVWLEKTTINDVHLIKDLKPVAKNLKLKLLRNKDKTAHIRAIASTLLKQGKVKVNAPLGNITRDDVVLNKKWLLHCKSVSMATSTVSADFITLVSIDKVNHDQKCWANQGT